MASKRKAILREPTETILNRQFLFIANNHPKVHFMIRMNTGEKIEAETATTKRRCIKYGTPGFPDLFGQTKWGTFFACETKRPSTIKKAREIERLLIERKPIKPTPENLRLRKQSEWRARINDGEGVAFLASSVEEFRAQLDALTPPPRVDAGEGAPKDLIALCDLDVTV